MRKIFSFSFLSPFIFLIILFSSCDGSKGKDKLTAENLIESIESYKAELMKTTSLNSFIEAEKQANEDLSRFQSSTEPLEKSSINSLVQSILDFNRQTYVHRLNLEGREQMRADIESMNESLDDMEIAMKIQAEKSKTVGEFLTAIIGS